MIKIWRLFFYSLHWSDISTCSWHNIIYFKNIINIIVQPYFLRNNIVKKKRYYHALCEYILWIYRYCSIMWLDFFIQITLFSVHDMSTRYLKYSKYYYEIWKKKCQTDQIVSIWNIWKSTDPLEETRSRCMDE